nr:hypothetical protein [Tanacetum cinerariifolium]
MNVDYVAILWEDFMYQADNREISSARKEHMPYPRFTKVIINHFISKDNTISMRNMINVHTVRETLLGILKFVSKTEDYQKYRALIPDGVINQDIKLSTAFKTYLDYATGKAPFKKARKFKKPASPKLKTIPTFLKEPTQKDTPDKSVSKKKALAKVDRGKGIEFLSDVVLLEDAQLKKNLRKSKRETHKLQDSGLSEGADFKSEIPDDQTSKTKDTRKGTEEEQDKEYVLTLEKDKSDDEDKMYEEEDDDVVKELYGDLNITQGLKDADMTNVEQGGADLQNASYESGFVHEEEDAHVTLTIVHDKTEGPLQSSLIQLYKQATKP